jgi:hypothetical protein
MSGQLALVLRDEMVEPAAIWETLPPATQRHVTVRLALVLAALLEDERDE